MAQPLFDPAEYFGLWGGCAFVELSAWSSISVRGNDRQSFLQNFCTNDIRRLSPEENCEAFITNVKGRIVGHGLFTRREGEFVFTTVPGQGSALVAHLERYIIREDVQVRDTTSERAYILLAGGPPARSTAMALAPTISAGEKFLRPLVNAAARLLDLPVRWIRWDLLGDVFCGLLETTSADLPKVRQALVEEDASRARSWPQCSQSAFHAFRIEAGMPLFGIDFDDSNLPQEVGRDKEAISFTKGCYLGQETVARIDALGHVNQRLVGVRFLGKDLPNHGAQLALKGAKVGEVTSVAFSPKLQAPLALAMLRREANAPGTRLESPVGDCEVIALPLVQCEIN